MSGITKGKWIVGYGDGLTGPRTAPSCFWDNEPVTYIPVSANGEAICWLATSSGTKDSLLADANLIAAARELLEALDKLLGYAAMRSDWLANGFDEPADHPISIARAAIAKAKGETK